MDADTIFPAHTVLVSQDFLKLLQEIVSGNKLSSSRVEKVKQAAVKCFYVSLPPSANLLSCANRR